MPHATLTGFCIEVQVCCEQVAPGAAQMPQLALQQTWPTLQVFMPHCTLTGSEGAPQ